MAAVLADPDWVTIVVLGEHPVQFPTALCGREAMECLQTLHGPGYLHVWNDEDTIATDQCVLELGTVYQYTRVEGTTTAAVATVSATEGAAATSATVSASITAAESIAVGCAAVRDSASNGTAADGAVTGHVATHGTAAIGSIATVGSTVAGGAGTGGAAPPRAVSGSSTVHDPSTGGHWFGLLTARQAICSPCPPIALSTSPRASNSTDKAFRPKTFKGLEELKGFDAGLQSLKNRLDDTENRHVPVVINGGQFMRAADEREVRAVFTILAPLINNVAKRMNIHAELLGGGNNVSISSTAWTILATTAAGSNSSSSAPSTAAAATTTAAGIVADPTTPAAAPPSISSDAAVRGGSSRLYGDVGIKGDWQAKLYLGEQLWLITDEQETKRFMPPLQQVYGNMVHDEVMWGVFTTINESVIVQRHRDVSNKTLFVSRVFGTDELLLALLYLTEQAALDVPTKQQLKRELVVVGPAECYTYTMSLPAVPAWLASGHAQPARPASELTVHVPSARPAKRQRQLEAASSAVACDSSSATIGGSLQQRFPHTSSDSNSGRCSALHSRFPHLVQLTTGHCTTTPDVQGSNSNSEGGLQVTLHGLDFSRVKTTSVLACGRAMARCLRAALTARIW